MRKATFIFTIIEAIIVLSIIFYVNSPSQTEDVLTGQTISDINPSDYAVIYGSADSGATFAATLGSFFNISDVISDNNIENYSDKNLDEAIVLPDISQFDPEETKVQFVADGCKKLPKPLRSPWHDYQDKRREGNRRDFISNVWATPMGASDTPFDHDVLERIKKRDIRWPDYVGSLHFGRYSNGLINSEDISLFTDIGGRFKWWGKLPFGRPEQRHNYIIAVDPSYG